MLCVLVALLYLYLSAGVHMFSTWRQSHHDSRQKRCNGHGRNAFQPAQEPSSPTAIITHYYANYRWSGQTADRQKSRGILRCAPDIGAREKIAV